MAIKNWWEERSEIIMTAEDELERFEERNKQKKHNKRDEKTAKAFSQLLELSMHMLD